MEKVTVKLTVNRDGSTVEYIGDRDLVQPLFSQTIAMQHAVPESDAVQISRDRQIIEGQKILSTVSISPASPSVLSGSSGGDRGGDVHFG